MSLTETLAAGSDTGTSGTGGITTVTTPTFGGTEQTSSGGSGTLGLGGAATFTVAAGDPVLVTGTPTLLLNDGGASSDEGGLGSSSLTFTTTIAAGQDAPALEVTGVTLPGGALANPAGSAASFATPPALPGTVQIDASTPTVTGVTVSGAGIDGGSGTLGLGGTATLTVATSEAVSVTGTPTLTLGNGGMALYSAAASTPTALAFTYMVSSGGTSTPDLSVSGLILPAGAGIANGTDDSATVMIEVRWVSGACSNTQNWSLTAHGD